MPALSKDLIAKAIAENVGLQRTQSVQLVGILIGLVKESLISGEDDLISGFGRFCVKKKRERRGRNPATGEDLMLASWKMVTFKCSGQLRHKINKLQ